MLSQWQADRLSMLRLPFPDEDVELRPVYVGEREANEAGAEFIPAGAAAKCPRCGRVHPLPAKHLRYVGHAKVTERLNQIDPEWSWEPMATLDNGEPSTAGGRLWIRLTVCGVTKIGVGDADGKTGASAAKEMVGDAIRNAAMRFGCGLEMWMGGPDDEVTWPEGGEPAGFAPRLGKRATRAQRELAGRISELDAAGVDGNEVADLIYNEVGERYWRLNEREVEAAMELLSEAFGDALPVCDGQEELPFAEGEVIPI